MVLAPIGGRPDGLIGVIRRYVSAARRLTVLELDTLLHKAFVDPIGGDPVA